MSIIRRAYIEDLDSITELESLCFPVAEAATKESFIRRLNCYPECFRLLIEDDKIISMVNGMTTDFSVLSDDMYSDISSYDKDGEWFMIFGVDTRPEYRRHGYAGKLLNKLITDVTEQNRKGIILTCKQELIPFYEKFGFVNEGESESKHGGVVWYQMKKEITAI